MKWPEPPQDPRFRMGINSRLTSGSLLRLSSPHEIADGLSDLPKLLENGYSEIEITGFRGGPTIYIPVKTVLDFPQVFVGYAEDGSPILLGVTDVFKGHCTVLGQTGSGKTTFVALILYQLIRLGFCCLVLGNKIFDPTLYGPTRSACAALTRRDDHGQPVAAPFRFATLAPGYKTSGLNYIEQVDRGDATRLMKASRLLDAFSLGATPDDPNRQFFWGQALRLFQSTPWGNTFQEFDTTIEGMRLDRDTTYATSGARDLVHNAGANPMLNLTRDNPATIDFEWLIPRGGAVYIEAAGLEVGQIGASASALGLQAFCSAKSKVDPLNQQIAFVVIDEAQTFPRVLLRNAINQCRALGIRVIFMAHSAQQFGDDYEILAQTQISVFFSALPGSSSERYLQASFGTRTDYDLTFNQNEGEGEGESTSINSDGVTTESTQRNSQNGRTFGITQRRDVPNWTSDDTKELNDNPLAGTIRVSPRQEFVVLDPGGNRLTCVGPPMPFSQINRMALSVTEDSPYTFLPGSDQEKTKAKQIADAPEREPLLKKLQQAAERIRNAA